VFPTLGLFFLLSSLTTFAKEPAEVQIRQGTCEDRSCYIVRTDLVTWYYDRSGGGFCRLVDRDGQDWIAFRKNPLNEFPKSAAAGYRGLPNLVFTGPDKGAGHPGFDRCTTSITSENSIRTTSISGQWSWTWSFTGASANFEMERAPGSGAWWFLYEGPIAGTFSPGNKYWGTDKGGPRIDVPDRNSQLYDTWKWVYFGDRAVPRVLVIEQHGTDQLPDTLWYLGNSQEGSVESPDGMVVFGFGRGPGTSPMFRGAGQRFTVSLLEVEIANRGDHTRLAEIIAGK
jgi:hypothetical protein